MKSMRLFSVAVAAMLLSGCDGAVRLELPEAEPAPAPDQSKAPDPSEPSQPMAAPTVPVSLDFYEELGRAFSGMTECKLIVQIPAHSPFSGIDDRLRSDITGFLAKQGIEVLSAARSAELEKSGIIPPILQYSQTVSAPHAIGARVFEEMFSVTDFMIPAHDPTRVDRGFTLAFSSFGYVDASNPRAVSRMASDIVDEALHPLEACFRNLARHPVGRQRFRLDPELLRPTSCEETLQGLRQKVLTSLVGIDRVWLAVVVHSGSNENDVSQTQHHQFRGLEQEAETLIRRKLKELDIKVIEIDEFVEGWEETGLPIHDFTVKLKIEYGDRHDPFVVGGVKMSLCGPAILQRDPTHVFRGYRYMHSIVCGEQENRLATSLMSSLAVGLEDFAVSYLRAQRWADAKARR